jgi:type VI protein secretion system component VasK
MGNMDEVATVVNNWWNYPLVWAGLVVAVFFILLFVLLWIKLSAISRASKKSFKDLSNKIESLARTSDAFSELNAKIDSLNRTTNEQKRPTTEYTSTI